MQKRAFTLVEMVMAIVILAILSTGTFVALKQLYLRSAKSKALSELSLESQIIVDQVASLLYERVPSSVIGYDGNETFESIYTLTQTYNILEWIGLSVESHLQKDYSGFVDMDDSNASNNELFSPGTDMDRVAQSISDKFDSGVALMFAGTFDDGSVVFSNDFNSTFGWHGNANATGVFTIDPASNAQRIILDTQPQEIYEKYYFVDSAYGVARGEDVDLEATCIADLGVPVSSDTLFLFYDYKPWAGDTFCADVGSQGTKQGSATVLSSEVSGFEAGLINGNIFFSLSMNRPVPRRSNENNVSISKQKVVF